MNLETSQALFKLYPQIAVLRGDAAYDEDGNEVAYDLQAVTAQAKADAQAIINAEQAKITAKQSALAKLAKLGLTENEVKALIG